MSSADHDNSSKLSELPGELILEVLQHLTVVRGYLLIPEEEAARRAENVQRVAALHVLTLVCRRLNEVVTPFLYESLTKLGQNSDWSHVDSLLRTITEKPALMDYVRYIETDGNNFDSVLAATLGARLERMQKIDYGVFARGNISDLHRPYLSCIWAISTLISLSQNLQGLAIDSYWERAAILRPGTNLMLCDVFVRNPLFDNGSLHISALSGTRFNPVPLLLSEYGVWEDDSWDTENSTVLCSDELRSESIDELALETNIRYPYLNRLLSRCNFLRRLRCRWTAARDGLPGAAINLKELRDDLIIFEDTLESLVLDTLDSSWLVELDDYIPTIGSLHEFTVLKHIEVSGMVLWNDDYDDDIDDDQNRIVKPPRLSLILPFALETLVINVEWDDYVEEGLADLAEDCAAHFPNLKSVACSWRPAPMFNGRDLIAEFEKAGVTLKLDVASCVEEEEERIEAEMIHVGEEIVWMKEKTEADEGLK